MQKIKVTKKIQKKTFIALDWKIISQDKKALAVKEQSDNLDFIKTKNLCSLKDSIKESERTNQRLRENMCNPYI